MKKLEHLSEIYTSYDTFIIDLWGVMHDGISLNYNAVKAVESLLKDSKKIVFLSNAPRPSEKVKEFLREMKMKENFLKNVVTSGEAAMQAINKNKFGKFFFHLGPIRDESIFYSISRGGAIPAVDKDSNTSYFCIILSIELIKKSCSFIASL